VRRGLIALALVGIGVAVGRRRFRRQLAAAVRLPGALAVVALAMPADWLDDLWGGITSVPGAIKDFVLGVVHDAVGWLNSMVDWLVRRVDDVVSWIGQAFDAVYSFASGIARDLVGWVSGLVDGVVRWAEGAIGAAWDFVSGVARWAEDAVGQLWSWITGALDQLGAWITDALGALWDWVQSLPQWVWDNVFAPLWDAVQWLWHEVVDRAIAWLLGLIGTLWDFAFGWARLLLEVVEKAFDWLVMLATHGPGWVVQQIDDTFHRAPELLARGFLGAVEAHGDSIERWFADWLG
jgi:hypothetical protein